MLSESWNTVTEVFFYTGPLSDALYFTLGGLMHGGFVEFWDSTAKSIEEKESKKLAVQLYVDEKGENDLAYMSSSIALLFKVFLVK